MAPKMPFPLNVTCVLSPSSLKLPISKVPSKALPMAALAVGADLCLLHACERQQQDIGVQPAWNVEMKADPQSATHQHLASVELCDADQAEVFLEAQASVLTAKWKS